MSQVDTGKRLEHFRRKAGWTQEKLWERSGVSKSNIQKLEKGGNPNLDTLTLLVKAYGVTLVEFFEEFAPRRGLSDAHVTLHQQLQDVLDAGGNWETLAGMQVEALHRGMLEDPALKKDRTGAEGV